MRITKQELKTRAGYFLFGFFGVYLADPIKEWVDSTFSINPIIVGFAGLFLVLFFFDF